MSESTPTVGRWNGTGWLCECRESMYNSPEADACHFCHAVRPPLPETPAPRVDDALCVCGHAASAHSCNGGVGDAECGCESFAALRAVPVEGGEPVAWAPALDGRPLTQYTNRHRAEVEEYVRFRRSLECDEVVRHEDMAVMPLYAHPAPDGDIRTVLLRFIDTAGNKRDLVTPDQTCALLDLLNELHPEDRPDGE